MIRLEDTSAGAIANAISTERNHMGATATGMVLTLLVMADEEYQADATAAAEAAARQHPMRIVTLIPRPHGQTRLDAEITVGGDGGPGELAILRLRGELAQHASSVVIPLLLTDTPVVAFWPSGAPEIPADDPIGRHAQRRVTDAAASEDPLAELKARKASYQPGDTDLAWARLTPWRSLLASVFDQAVPHVTSGRVTAEADNPSAVLMAQWLHHCLKVPVEVVADAGPGLTSVTLQTPDGPIEVKRPDGRNATLARPNAPESHVVISRPSLGQLLAEELRRLDPDDTYGAVIRGLAV